jgi:hypothetical protein
MVWSDVNPAKEESRDGTTPLVRRIIGRRKKRLLGWMLAISGLNVLEELKNC